MPGKRIMANIYIPDTVWASIPSAKKQSWLTMFKELRSFASKINEGKPNEEMTISATIHDCYHDEAGNHPPCEPKEL